jgi:hypothetical protein
VSRGSAAAEPAGQPPAPISQGRIARFWLPLALTWLMMALEGPFLAAVIARLAEAKVNLAAWGVAYALALLVEAPVIMMMSASTALARDRRSFQKLRRFARALNVFVTLAMGLLLLPPVFDLLALRLIGLPEPVARLTHLATLVLLPWPGAIGYRRFHQGLLISHDLTRRVAYGTVVRLAAMAATALALFVLSSLPGAVVGAAALSVGVVLEAVAARVMADPVVRALRAGPRTPAAGREVLGYGAIVRFYLPLAATSLLALGLQPLVTFFVGRSRGALESLAVLPVIGALAFLFRALGLAYQEVAIALMGTAGENRAALRRFAATLGLAASGALALIAWTPLAELWYRDVSGLTPSLTAVAIVPTRILVPLPALAVWLSFQRAQLVLDRRTGWVTGATGLEVATTALVLALGILVLDLFGALAAAAALALGRLSANLFLLYPLGTRVPGVPQGRR